GGGEPVLEEEMIAFNGCFPKDCESFVLSVDEREGFCKTDRLPYDLAVQVALILLKFHGEEAGHEVRLDSDGNLMDWQKACALVEAELGYPVDPFWALGREIRVVEAASGLFYLEWPKEKELKPEKISWWLAQLHQRELLPFAPPYRFQEVVRGIPPARPLREGWRIYVGL
ncbi:MAG: hypothetical protein C4291_14780, partial [Candidatus Dadabacteria bacterium]